jgi:hypothetical protein
MFIVASERRFSWPVEFWQVGEDGQRTAKAVTFQFRQIKASAFAQLLRDLHEASAKAQSEEEAVEAATAIYERIVLGWDSAAIGEADATPLAFSRQALATVLDMFGAGTAIVTAYSRAVTGTGAEENRRGN